MKSHLKENCEVNHINISASCYYLDIHVGLQSEFINLYHGVLLRSQTVARPEIKESVLEARPGTPGFDDNWVRILPKGCLTSSEFAFKCDRITYSRSAADRVQGKVRGLISFSVGAIPEVLIK